MEPGALEDGVKFQFTWWFLVSGVAFGGSTGSQLSSHFGYGLLLSLTGGSGSNPSSSSNTLTFLGAECFPPGLFRTIYLLFFHFFIGLSAPLAFSPAFAPSQLSVKVCLDYTSAGSCVSYRWMHSGFIVSLMTNFSLGGRQKLHIFLFLIPCQHHPPRNSRKTSAVNFVNMAWFHSLHKSLGSWHSSKYCWEMTQRKTKKRVGGVLDEFMRSTSMRTSSCT